MRGKHQRSTDQQLESSIAKYSAFSAQYCKLTIHHARSVRISAVSKRPACSNGIAQRSSNKTLQQAHPTTRWPLHFCTFHPRWSHCAAWLEYDYPKGGIVGTPSDKTWRCWHARRYSQPLGARPESSWEISAERRVVELRFGLGSTLLSEIARPCDQRIEVPPSDHQTISSLLMEEMIQEWTVCPCWEEGGGVLNACLGSDLWYECRANWRFVELRQAQDWDLMLVAPNLDHPAAMSKLSFAAG